MKYLILILLGISFVGCVSESDEQNIKEQIIKLVQNAYAEGQRDAIEGDVRIEIVSDSQVIFVKSPWDECSDEGNFKCDPELIDTITTSQN